MLEMDGSTMAAGLAGLVAATFELGQPALAHRQFEGRRIVTGIEQRAGRGAIRKGLGRDEVATEDVQRVQPELDRDPLDQAFEREIHLRPAEAAHQAGGRLVGQHYPVAHQQVVDRIGAGETAVHAIEGGRLGRAQIAPHIVELVEGQRGNAPIRLHCRAHCR
jgi:hypothetical protein